MAVITVEDLLGLITNDTIAVVFVFVLLPLLAMILNSLSKEDGESGFFGQMYSLVVYVSAITGVLSGTIWLYSMLYETKSLWDLDVFVYYLPMISMIATFVLVQQKVHISELPGIGNLYILLGLISAAFALVLLMIKIGVFKEYWQIFLSFAVLFIILKFLWNRFEIIILKKKK